MKYIVIALFAFLMSGCLFIDDGCHYETYCKPVDRCNYICDIYGYNCIVDSCWKEQECWDEYVCSY